MMFRRLYQQNMRTATMKAVEIQIAMVLSTSNQSSMRYSQQPAKAAEA